MPAFARRSAKIALLALTMLSGCGSDKPTDPVPDPGSDAFAWRLTTDNFKFYSTRDDESVIDTVSVLLESNLARLISLYGYTISDKIKVYIYPDFESFHEYVDWPTDDIPDWLVGQCVSPGAIGFVSPQCPELTNTYEQMLDVAVHEFIHAYHFNIYGDGYPPNWLFEGFAMYEAGMLPNWNVIRQRISSGNLPLIQQFDIPDYFDANYGGDFSYTIFEYLLNTFDYAAVAKLLKYPALLEYSLGAGVTMDSLNAGWHAFIIDKYGG